MILLPPDFKEFLQLLNSNNVEYLLIGGYAVGYYGYPRATADMDIWINATLQNAERLVAAFGEFGFNKVSTDMFLRESQVIRMGLPPLRIEVLTSISGVSFSECYSERAVVEIDEIKVNLISLDHLKANKKASGRFKDLDDLEHLP
jgi:predicted nucleotidyltransferase